MAGIPPEFIDGLIGIPGATSELGETMRIVVHIIHLQKEDKLQNNQQ